MPSTAAGSAGKLCCCTPAAPCVSLTSAESRWCVIADGELRYYKHFPGAGDAWLKHAPTGSLPVEGAKIAIANRGQAHPFAFDVVTETRAFHFEANSEVGPRALPLAPHPADKLVAPRSWNWQTG